jgi:sigma-B regulation protein RsbU (phosphoserine phosphatase)
MREWWSVAHIPFIERAGNEVETMADIPANDQLSKLERENVRLKAALQELSILNDIATAINSSTGLDKLIERIVHKSIKHLGAEQGTITLLESLEQDSPFRTMIRSTDTSRDVLPYHLDTQLTGWMLKNKKPLLINNFQDNDDFRTVQRDDYPIRSLLTVPLMLKGRLVGMLNVFNKRDEGGFTDGDKRLLTIIATQSSQVIENSRLLEEQQRFQLMQEEMRLACKIQMDLLPAEAPLIAGYDHAGRSIPAKTVGGDYFDFIQLDDHRIAVCLGDVAGKGMPAALLMANLQATLRAQSTDVQSATCCIKRSNKLMFKNTDIDKFVTLFYGILDCRSHELSYCNAGHNYPFLIRDNGKIDRLSVGGLVLGALEEFDYCEDSVQLNPGDMLLIFSDGISEAQNEAGDFYGEERLGEIVAAHRGESAAQVVDSVMESIRDYVGETPQSDDMTILVSKRNPS